MNKIIFLQNILNIAGDKFSLYLEYFIDIENIFKKNLWWRHIDEKNIIIVKDSYNNIIEDAIFCIIVKDTIICNNLTNFSTEIINLLNLYIEEDIYIYIYPTEKIKKNLLESLILVLYDTDPYNDRRDVNEWIQNQDNALVMFFKSIVSEYLAIEICKKNGSLIQFFNKSLQSNSYVAIAAISDIHYSGMNWIEYNLKKNKDFMLSALKISEFYIFDCSLDLLTDKDILELGVKKLSKNLFAIDWYNSKIDKILDNKKYNLKCNKNFMLFAVEIDGRNINKASFLLQKDLDIIRISHENYIHVDFSNTYHKLNKTYL